VPSEILVAIIAGIGTLVGTFGGIMASNKLVNYRLEMLEKKVDTHNNVIERTYILEEKMKVANHRIEDLEDKQK
jgi:hypothetical protein